MTFTKYFTFSSIRYTVAHGLQSLRDGIVLTSVYYVSPLLVLPVVYQARSRKLRNRGARKLGHLVTPNDQTSGRPS